MTVVANVISNVINGILKIHTDALWRGGGGDPRDGTDSFLFCLKWILCTELEMTNHRRHTADKVNEIVVNVPVRTLPTLLFITAKMTPITNVIGNVINGILKIHTDALWRGGGGDPRDGTDSFVTETISSFFGCLELSGAIGPVGRMVAGRACGDCSPVTSLVGCNDWFGGVTVFVGSSIKLGGVTMFVGSGDWLGKTSAACSANSGSSLGRVVRAVPVGRETG